MHSDNFKATTRKITIALVVMLKIYFIFTISIYLLLMIAQHTMPSFSPSTPLYFKYLDVLFFIFVLASFIKYIRSPFWGWQNIILALFHSIIFLLLTYFFLLQNLYYTALDLLDKEISDISTIPFMQKIQYTIAYIIDNEVFFQINTYIDFLRSKIFEIVVLFGLYSLLTYCILSSRFYPKKGVQK